MDTDPMILLNRKELIQQVVYLTGTSFILGSLITILLLMAVDFVRNRLNSD
ncbi:MAG: hypothetical protein K2Q01_01845 [Rickettsiales bacterium]|nr:hypothetical protein [Rickettsiales bacterium]